jgi:hypothetical protein
MWNFDEKHFMMGRGGRKTNWLSPECGSKPLENSIRKLGMDYVDRICFGNWKKTTCLLYHHRETSFLCVREQEKKE